VLFLGAGEAATGIADLIVSAMVVEGLTEAEAIRRNWLVDSRGLVVKDRPGLTEHKLRYAHDQAPIDSFLAAINTLKPTAIIGVAAVGGAFTAEVLQTMAGLNDRPIVFALSNPTSKAECSAEEAYRHTGGRALFACGSPYDPVNLDGKTFVPRQGNNSYIFPGVGLGATACGARLVTDEMFMVAAHALAQLVSEDDLAQGSLYPALPRIREVSANIAEAVAVVAYNRGLAAGHAPNDMAAFIQSKMYDPRY
jgi:malate dehydrogenase (oxaloacetate-decarboxylating)(NADP+)